MYWSRKATFEWSDVQVDQPVADNQWFDCMPRTRKALSDIWASDVGPHVGLEIQVDDEFLHTETFVVKQVLPGQLLLLERKDDDDLYTMAIRPLHRKLLYAEHDKEENLIRLCSMMSGEAQDSVPFDKFKDYTWLNFEKKVAEHMKLSPGRVLLFPSHLEDMEELQDFKENHHRQSRLLVKNALDLEKHDRQALKRPAASKRPAAKRSAVSKRPAASSSSSCR